MNTQQRSPVLPLVALALALACVTPQARANVYATNFRLNGSTNSPTVVAGHAVSIGYLLNEPASDGVTLRILRGTNAVRTLFLASGTPGTSRGTNTVTWDGRNEGGGVVAGGDYVVSITAAATGYTTWTQISSDTNAGNQLTGARGIAVNQNTNSLYYGRVFVANAYPAAPDARVFHKLNADGSPADEGMLSNGGYPWLGGPSYESPFRVRVGADDRFYALDFADTSKVLSWDQEITTNSILQVMRDDNNPTRNLFSGFCITGTDTNRQLWMCDTAFLGVGIYRWNVQANGTLATNDTGTQVVAVGGDLTDSCYDAVVDTNGRIYALCEPLSGADFKLMRFPPYTNAPLTNADWKTDSDSASTDPYAIAVNPAASYVAVARAESKSVWILDASSGAMVTTISSNGFPHYAVAWDNVGNVYSCFDGESNSVWQAWSPPGTNQATTYGPQSIHVVQAPIFTGVVPNGQDLVLKFAGPADASPSAFTVLSGEAPTGITNVVTTAVVTGSGGLFQALVPANGPRQFYRIALTSGIYITRLRVGGGTVKLDFTGSADDAASAFTVLSGSVPTGITNVAPTLILGTNGVFEAIFSSYEPRQFYRIRR